MVESTISIDVKKDEAVTPPPTKKEELLILEDKPDKKDVPPPPPPKLSKSYPAFGKNSNTLLVVNGEISNKNIDDFSPAEIESISVLKNEMATEKYGDAGKNGVIEIITKPVFVIVEDMPKYPGGHDALQAYIKKEAAKVGKQGTAVVNFKVSTKGTVEEVKVVKTSGDKALDKKAIEIVEGMEKWTPGKQRGKPVSVKYNIEIEF